MSLRVLITNDDGIDAPGLEVIRQIALGLTEDVWVVAPDGNQSGAGHRFTLGRELSFDQRGPQTFAVVGGSPADCVVAGYTHLLGGKAPDLVLSGVNQGQNLGDLINCSGTVAGAREAALQGALGIGMSQSIDFQRGHGVDWTNSIRHGLSVVRTILAQAQGHAVYYNVNFPNCPPDDVAGIQVVPHQRFSRSVFRYYPSDNAGKFFIAIPETPLPLDPAHDFEVLRRDGAITVTPLALAQTDMSTLARLQGKLTL
ncbi:5'/3'-nucleotidase SurE [Devosia sp.]|uniref:5'/3'-nucleotidase SurE n=1 Tax=Devosia sp. TaxID=1871048 RepID=UPI0032658307